MYLISNTRNNFHLQLEQQLDEMDDTQSSFGKSSQEY